jgi:predicted phosphodiesterase
VSKIALITDTHAGVRNDLRAFHESSAKFYREVFFPRLVADDIRVVVHLGDVLDRRRYVTVETANRLRTDFIEPLLDMGVEYHQILGNHDVLYRNTNRYSAFIELFHSYPLRIHSDPTEVELEGTRALIVPWINDENRAATMDAISSTRAEVCLGHLELSGFEMYRGVTMNHGDDPATFSRFDVVCSGHYHHKSSRGNVHYLGTHQEFTWADHDDPRGFHVLDLSDRSLTHVRNPYRMFRTVVYDDSASAPVAPDGLTDAYVRVVVTDCSNRRTLDDFLSAIESASPIDLQVIDERVTVDELEVRSDAASQSSDATVDIMRSFVSTLNTRGHGGDAVLDELMDVYDEAVKL